MTESHIPERLLKIADLKQTIKQLQLTLEDELDLFQKEIELGMLADFERDGSIVYENIRCTPVVTKRWVYNQAAKDAIKKVQEKAQYSGDAKQEETSSLRFTF